MYTSLFVRFILERLKIRNKYISTPIATIIKDIRKIIFNGKLSVVKDRGDNIRVTCPFHKGGQENKASADIYIGGKNDKVQYGWFKCFTCDEQGPFEYFVASCLEVPLEKAKDWLIENYADESNETLIDLPEICLSKKSNRELLDESILNEFESFHPYLIKRNLSKKIIDLFEVKYDTKTKCIVFPVRDERKDLVMLTRRSTIDKTFIIDEDKQKPLYLLYYILDHNIDFAMITEGQIDALTACTYDFPCVATMGAISDHQIDLINKSGIRILYTMFDNDSAGKRFTHKLLKNIRKDILVINVPIIIPGKKDINDLTFDEFYKCISSAENNRVW